MVKLFVGGFPLDSTELAIVQLISPYAEVSTIKIVRDKISKKCKGYAFVEVTDDGGADRAIEALDGLEMGNKALTLNKVTEQPAKPQRPAASYPQRPKRPRRIA